MAIKCRDIAEFMEETAPLELAEEWDNVGLIIGDPDKTVRTLCVCLDVTPDAINEAVRSKADLLVAHHPPVFNKINRIITGDTDSELIIPLIRNDLSVYAAHTNLDSADGGVAAAMAETLSLQHVKKIGSYGYCRIGSLSSAMDASDFEKYVMDRLQTKYLCVIGENQRPISRIAVYPGSFGDGMDEVLKAGPDALVTGEAKYHSALVLKRHGLYTLVAGHYNTEKVILPVLAELLQQRFKDLDVLVCSGSEPYKSWTA